MFFLSMHICLMQADLLIEHLCESAEFCFFLVCYCSIERLATSPVVGKNISKPDLVFLGTVARHGPNEFPV